MARQRQHVLVLGVEPQSLLNFRKDLIAELLGAGHRVTVASLPQSRAQQEALIAMGAEISSVAFSRAGMNPFRDIRTMLALRSLFNNLKPDTVIAYTAKPVIYGALAARLAGIKAFVAMITGLGFSFVDGPERARKIARLVATRLYKLALRFCAVVIFQNPDDRKTFADLGLLDHVKSTGLVNGSGVDVSHFSPVPLPDKPVFLMVARLLNDKGIREYAAATARLRERFPGFRTLLVGALDPSPNSISQTELDEWVSNGLEYLGVVEDVRPAIAQANVVVLPSYREGTPRSVLEGMAMGRAIITTDVPGCRETVQDGKTGYMIPARNSDALLTAMINIASEPSRIAAMGVASRAYVLEKFEAKAVARSVIHLAGLS